MEEYHLREIARQLFGNDTSPYSSSDLDLQTLSRLPASLLTFNHTGEGGSESWNDEVEGEGRRQTYEEALSAFRDTLYTYKQPQALVLLCLYVPVFLVALAGNVLVLLVVLPNRYMRSVTNCFIVNLAIADLLVTVVNVPLEISIIAYREWVYGEALCKFTSYLQGACVAASVFTIMTLSVDRYLALKRPSTFRKYSASNNAWKVACIVWTVSSVAMAPLLNVRQLRVVTLFKHHPVYFCVENWPSHAHRTAYDIFLFAFMVITPSVFVSLCYSLLFYHLWHHDRPSMATAAGSASIASSIGGQRGQGQCHDLPLTLATSKNPAVVSLRRVASGSAMATGGGAGGKVRLSPRSSDCRLSFTPSSGMGHVIASGSGSGGGVCRGSQSSGAGRDELSSSCKLATGSGSISGDVSIGLRTDSDSGLAGKRAGSQSTFMLTAATAAAAADRRSFAADQLQFLTSSAKSQLHASASANNECTCNNTGLGLSKSCSVRTMTTTASRPATAHAMTSSVVAMTTLKQVSQVARNRQRVAKMLLLLTILFVLCWTPYHVINISIDFMPVGFNENTVVIALLHYSVLLGHVNSALNPILYCFLNTNFRQAAIRLLHLRRKVRRGQRSRQPVPPDSPQPALDRRGLSNLRHFRLR